MKKIFWGILIGMFMVFSVSAQSKIDNFSGKWKLMDIPKDWQANRLKRSAVSVEDFAQLNISKIDKDLKFERVWQNSTKTVLFKGNETSSTYKQNGINEKCQIFFIDSKRIRLETTIFNIGYRTIETEEWSLSPDGKTLTITSTTKNEDNSKDGMYPITNNLSKYMGNTMTLVYSKL